MIDVKPAIRIMGNLFSIATVDWEEEKEIKGIRIKVLKELHKLDSYFGEDGETVKWFELKKDFESIFKNLITYALSIRAIKLEAHRDFLHCVVKLNEWYEFMDKHKTFVYNDKVNHLLKISEKYYKAIFDGSKTFEIRYNDRHYQVGDTIQFVLNKGYSSKYEITYILDEFVGLQEKYIIMSIRDYQEVTLEIMAKCSLEMDHAIAHALYHLHNKKDE